VPSKTNTALCLKLFKKILLACSWKIDKKLKNSQLQQQQQHKNELDNKTIANNLLFNNIILNNNLNLNNNSNANLNLNNQEEEDFDEVFSIVNLLSVVCKCIVLSFSACTRANITKNFNNNNNNLLTTTTTTNNNNKSNNNNNNSNNSNSSSTVNNANDELKNISYQVLFDYLPSGTKSDIANSVLESLNNCIFNWKNRFELELLEYFKNIDFLHNNSDVLLFDNNNNHTHNNNNNNNHNSSTYNKFEGGKHDLVFYSKNEMKKRFLLQNAPAIPASVVFKNLSIKLTLPKTVEDFVCKLFTHNN
jgi:hypothetical protein